MSYEITVNPDVLCNHSISVYDMTLYGHKLQDTGASIPRDIIIDTSMEQLPQGVVSVSRREKKTYYQQNNQEIEYTLEDRITSVMQHEGWLHTVFGVSYVAAQ
jgi:hypothetical protein